MSRFGYLVGARAPRGRRLSKFMDGGEMVHSHIKGVDGVLVGTIDNIQGGYWIMWRDRTEEFPGRVHVVERRIYRNPGDAREAVYRMCPGATIVDVGRD